MSACSLFAADDLTKIRGQEMKTTRDNIIFELGLFVGRLGRKRSFVVMPKGIEGLHLPSDLVGLNMATFAIPTGVRRLVAALGPACNKVRRAIQDTGTVRTLAPSEGGSLALLFSLALPETQQKHLANLAEGKTTDYQGCETLRSELRHLVSVGLLEKLPGRHIGDMKSGDTYDLTEFVKLTDSGRQWAQRIKQSRSKL
ncbi:MAG TPA: TIR domain-containing protein [Terriglobia bacterium]|nr:TIR domain-containing protein [Terriglobia bacterium]